MSTATAIELGLAPLDAVRRGLLQLFAPWVRPFIVDRDARVALIGALVLSSSLAATMTVPLWVLALGPVLIGVPHLLADFRYLVIRPGLHRRPMLCAAIGGPLLVASVLPTARWGMLATAGALLAARGGIVRKLSALALWGVVYWVVVRAGRGADLFVAHAHNLIAIAVWWLWWRPVNRRVFWWGLALFTAATAVLYSGAAEHCLVRTGGFVTPDSGLKFGRLIEELTPRIDPRWGLRLVLWYAFAQSVHYGIWLRIIPEHDRVRATPRSFVASFRALMADFGAAPLIAVGALALGLAVWAVFDLAAARDGYLRASLWHGYLEFAVIALFWAERRPSLGGVDLAAQADRAPQAA